MADGNRSFWTSTSGVATGLAGTLTGIVGIATLASQMGWIGPGDGSTTDTTATAASGSPSSTTDGGDDGLSGLDDRTTSSSRAGRNATTTADPTYSVDPSAVTFESLGSRTATVTVRNTGTVALDVEQVSVDGEDAGRFSFEAPACTSASLDPGRSCAVEVTFSPEGGAAEAVLVVEADGAPAQEVPLKGAALL